MMDQKLQQIQVLYEIALSVGRSLSLHEMLKKALFAYLRKLNCTAALVYKVSPTLAGLNQALQVFTLPYTYNINERFAGLHELLPEKMTVGQLKDWEKDLPCLGKTDDDQYYHILSLGEYGLLVLIKGSEYIDRDLLHSLADINDKLGKACMACESNESLQESEKKYRDLAELLPEMVCETDLEGNFTFVNEYALHRFGYGKEELIKGFSFLRIFAPQEAQKVRDNFQRALAHDNLPPREYQVITKRGEIFPVLVYTSRLMVNKKASGIRGVMIDITERKRMEQELKFERDLFHNFMDYIPAEVYFKDRDGRFVEVNQMKADQHNLSKEELLGKTDFDFYPEKEAVTKLEDENFIMETEEQVRKEEEVNSTYGKRWVMTYKAPRYDQDMEVIGTVGLSLDISDRVLMERKLQRSEIRLREYTERLESALIGSNAGLWDWNIKTGNVFYSDRWYAMLGYPKTELKPGLETWEALIHPEDKPAVMRVLTMHLEGETEFYRSEHRLKTKAGQWKWILDTGKVTERNEKGEPVRAVGTHIDIDQLKQYELTLQQNLDQQELLSEIALQLNSLVDFQNRIDQVLNQIGNHTGVSRVYIFEDAEEGSVTNNTFEWCNKGVEAQIEELQGIPYEIIPSWKKFLFSEGRVYSENILELPEDLQAILEPQGIKSIVVYPLWVNGQFFGFLGFDECSRIKKWGKSELELLRTVSGIISNAFERRLMEESLISERDKANRANAAKSEFLANMSHEIRTPMNAILGFSEALYHKLESPQHKKMVRSVLSSGNLLLSLLNDILDLSKIEAGKMDLSLQPVDLAHLLQEIYLLFEEKARKKGLHLELNVPHGFPGALLLDEIRIKQVLFNLVGNAIKFTPRGYVRIQAQYEPSSSKQGKLILEVEDSGIGIPESQQEVVFEVFRQQSGQSNREYEGVGLGLAISKRLIEKMKGRIEVESEVKKGSVFRVSLPTEVNKEEMPSVSEILKKENDVRFESGSLLVVDDINSNIETVVNLLDGTGLNILTAKSGEIAMEILKFTPIDMVLLDIRMPGMDGYQVAREIRKEGQWDHIKVIACTASVLNPERIESNGDFDGLLFKPVRRDELLGQLTRYLPYEDVPPGEETEETCCDEQDLDDLPEEIQVRLPELVGRLKDEFQGRWEAIRDTLVLYKIEGFGNDIRSVGEEYQLTYLSDYAEQILEALEIVDLDAMRSAIQVFPHILSTIESKIKTEQT